MISKNVDKELIAGSEDIIKFLDSLNCCLDSVGNKLYIENLVELRKVEKPSLPHFNDTLIYNQKDRTYPPFRTYTFYYPNKRNVFQITIAKSLEETDFLVERVMLIIGMIILIFIFSIYFLNRFLFNRIWYDFFETIEKLKAIDVDRLKDTQMNESYIEEFGILNTSLGKMFDKLSKDLYGLKEFSENMSHEIQTPLSIIKSNAEVLIQDESLSAEHFKNLSIIIDSCNRLIKISKSLLLITKIENKQFIEKQDIDIAPLVHEIMNHFEDYLSEKGITFENQLSKFLIRFNTGLAETLLVNLIKNSVRHNISGGIIRISCEGSLLILSNSGREADIDTKDIFNRFVKTPHKIESTGLGLAIVKKICDFNDLKISYSYQSSMHTITIDFKKVMIQ
jgi:signal transduction histidine kinase